MNTNLLEALWNVITLALIMEAVAVVELNHFKTGGVNPLCSTMFLIQFHGVLVVPRVYESVLVFWGSTEGPELGLIGHAKHVLLASGNGFEAFPNQGTSKRLLSLA
jgi:hypothetical protein